jgi:hypothetical protein
VSTESGYSQYHERLRTKAQARAAVFECIEVFSNHQRLHAAPGSLSPERFEAAGNG